LCDTHNSVVPAVLDLMVDVTLAIMREQHCDPTVADCCSAEAAGSRASAACRLGAALWLNAGRTESRTSVGADFRIAGRMQRCHARVDADAASPKHQPGAINWNLVTSPVLGDAVDPTVDMLNGARDGCAFLNELGGHDSDAQKT
jgi:hypothetical protein